ncbi:MAG TPA: Maf family protein [Anaerolineaceae bacterium]|nr:Maf family protein [Anaerolineaceae bacterium]
MFEPHLILASTSPRRNELLCLLGIPFEKRPSNADETHHEDVDAVEYVQQMAREKGLAVLQTDGEWILSADTIVALDGQVVGKPADEAEAYQILRALRGRGHKVYTALCLRTENGGEAAESLCDTDVFMRDYTEDELAAYIASADYKDKAGGYAIQHKQFHPCTGVEGCYANVMGLPLCHLAMLLESAGCKVEVDVPQACQRYNQITCEVYPQIYHRENPG